MNLLYLTGDYLYSKVHNNLICNLLDQDPGLTVYVFSPVRVSHPHGLEDSFRKDERLIEIIPQIDIPVFWYKLDFWSKLRCKIRLIEKYVPLDKIDLIHATTLYSEGCTALRLQKKYNIPYVASIRGTDAMFYAQKMPHLWYMGIRALQYAKAITCVTPSIRECMKSRWQHRRVKSIIGSVKILSNGVDQIWLDNINNTPKKIQDPIKVLYIGRFDKNKNVLRLLDAIKRARKNYNIFVTLIGGKGEEHNAVLEQVQLNPDFIEYLGPVYEKEKLKNIVRNCDVFAMVSHSETFGLVYAECLTQGIPLLYTKGTGFDNIFLQGEVGYAVDSWSAESITEGLLKIIENYKDLRNHIEKVDYAMFSWQEIASRYLKIYKTVVH